MSRLTLNPLNPRDASKYYFPSLNNDLISNTEPKFSTHYFKNNDIFFHLQLISTHPQPLQVENCGSNLRLVVDEDDNGEFRLERVKALN